MFYPYRGGRGGRGSGRGWGGHRPGLGRGEGRFPDRPDPKRPRFDSTAPNEHRPRAIEVKTNMFPITAIGDMGDRKCFVYKMISVAQGKKQTLRDDDNNPILDESGKRQYKFEVNCPRERHIPEVNLSKAGDLGWRILKKLCKGESHPPIPEGPRSRIRGDGSSVLCCDDTPLFGQDEQVAHESGGRDVLGSAKTNSVLRGTEDHHVCGVSPTSEKDQAYMDYWVTVRQNCDDDDQDADRVPYEHFRVRLSTGPVVPMRELWETNGERNETADTTSLRMKLTPEQLQEIRNVMVKGGQLSSVMKAYGSNRDKLYFSDDMQEQLIPGGKLRHILTDPKKKFEPKLGLIEKVRPCSGELRVIVDVCADYFDRKHRYQRPCSRRQAPVRIPLLDEDSRTIVGVHVDLNRPITDIETRQKITEAIKKLKFDVEFTRKKLSPGFHRKAQEQGWDARKFEQEARCIHKNRIMIADAKKGNAGILWAADDPQIYEFPAKKAGEGDDASATEMRTVSSHFIERHGIKLKFPQMPTVFIGNNKKAGGYFPIEVLYQSPQKTKDANSDEQKNAILDYNKAFAGTPCVDNICALIQTMSTEQDRLVTNDTCQLIIDPNPMTLKAEVLDPPVLKSRYGNIEPNNGSWRIRQFDVASDLSAFAVIDFTRGHSNDCMNAVLKAMSEADMTMPEIITLPRFLDVVTIQEASGSLEHVYGAFSAAILRAKEVFWWDKRQLFFDNHVWFKTNVTNPLSGSVEEVLLMPQGNEDSIGVIRRGDHPTHRVVKPDDGEEFEARIMVKIYERRSGNCAIVDPFDFRLSTGHHQAGLHEARRQGHWEPVDFVEHVYRVNIGENETTVVGPSDIRDMPEFIYLVGGNQLPPISMIFAYMPTNDSCLYSSIKMMSQHEFGVPSQCLVDKNFRKQMNPKAYCSGVATKLNAKLMNKWNNARAWGTFHSVLNGELMELKAGIPWVAEAPTLVIGIDVVNAPGETTPSVVAASVCLDEGCMQMAQVVRVHPRSMIVSRSTMIDIVKVLWNQYVLHTTNTPQRLLIYRGGGVVESDRERMLHYEYGGIRRALLDLAPDSESIPKVTLVMCVRERIRIVPDISPRRGGLRNVRSGTACDDPRAFLDDELTLTAQGGSNIGTSKPILYKVLINENETPVAGGSSPLTKEVLKLCTFHQSFQYATASKSIRNVPVLQYASRLAQTFMGYRHYIRFDPLDCEETDELERVRYVRADCKEEASDVVVGTELSPNATEPLPAFSPRDANGTKQPPARPHLSA